MTALSPNGTDFTFDGPEKAPVVVLIHGLGLNKNCWQWMIPDLKDSYRVLSYDLFGHGGLVTLKPTQSVTFFKTTS